MTRKKRRSRAKPGAVMGRPARLSDPVRVNVMLEADDLDWLRRMARYAGMSVSAYLRKRIRTSRRRSGVD